MAAWETVLDELVRTRASALVGYAYLLCGDRREAEDLVQDALVKTFSRGRGGLDVHNVEAYVRRAVLTTYLDGFRRRRRWAAVRHLVGTEESRSGPEAGAVERLDVATALDGLAPRERACVVLRFYEDLTVPDIADALALSQGSVKRYLSDGVRRMESLLGPMPEAHDATAATETTAPVDLTTTGATTGTSTKMRRTR